MDAAAIPWQHDLEAAGAEARDARRLVLVDLWRPT
jgi:hypothetical protein